MQHYTAHTDITRRGNKIKVFRRTRTLGLRVKRKVVRVNQVRYANRAIGYPRMRRALR